MNKLISRNPVQRFKQGRKIQKALLGTVISNLLLPLTYKGAKKTANFIGQAIDGMKKGSIPETKQKTNIVVGGSNKGYGIGKPESNVEKVPDKLINSDRRKGITPSKVTNRVLPKYSGVDLQGKTVDEWQNILKDYYAEGTPDKYKTDGIWGAATNAAYEAYLKSQSSNGLKYTPGVNKDNKFTSTGPTVSEFNRNILFKQPEQQKQTTFGPGTFNTNFTYNRGNIRSNRGINYSNVDEYWDYLNKNKNSNDFKLFQNIMRTNDGNLNREAFNQIMAQYGIKGNLGKRDSGRLANLLNDLNLIGTEGSDARNAFIDSYNNSFDLAQRTGKNGTVYSTPKLREQFEKPIASPTQNQTNFGEWGKQFLQSQSPYTYAQFGIKRPGYMSYANYFSNNFNNMKFKQGGQLPSRNIIERFKEGRRIIFAQGGAYFPVTVGGRTYQYNPYNGSYKGTQGSGQNISYKDIEGAFNKQYEGVSHSGSKVYRKKGSHTTWTNSAGKQVNLAPAKKAQPNTSFKTSANGRFRVVDQISGKELRFDSRDEAKKYQMSATKQGTRVLYDDKKEGYGVLKVDRTKEKSTEWARNQRETNNNKSFKDAYNNARSKGDRWFAYQGKVYNSDLKDYKNDNLTEMKAIYGNDLGWGKDPKYNTKSSAQARNVQNKEIKAQNSNRNANYKGKTNKQASAEADKKVAQTYNEEDLVDAFLPATAFGNGMNYLASTIMGEDYHPEVFHSGLNPAVGMANLMRGEWNKVGERALNAASVFGGPWIGKGVKWLGTKMAPEITNLGSKSAYLSQKATIPAANGTGRTLNKMAERAVSGNFTSPTTTYGRYSLQNAANNGVLDQFAVNGGFNNAARWGDRLVRNNNTGTGYIFRSGTTHPYDAAVDAGTKVIPWATSLGTPVVSTTLHNLTED